MVEPSASKARNEPAPLSPPEPTHHPDHHTPSAGRNRTLDGPVPPFRPYREEWPEHFALCFQELGAEGDAEAAYVALRELLGEAPAFPESKAVVEALGRRMPVALLSNADDDFLRPCLERNGLAFPVVVSSESARVYKPHVAIFRALGDALALPLESILYVGDSRFADVAGAKNAGMHAAWVNRKGAANRPLEAAADGSEEQAQARERQLPPPDFEVGSLDRLLEIISAP
jgi:2-haloalkanoic acid dehalogenase type II